MTYIFLPIRVNHNEDVPTESDVEDLSIFSNITVPFLLITLKTFPGFNKALKIDM